MNNKLWLRSVSFFVTVLISFVAFSVSATDLTADELAQKFRDLYSTRQSRSFVGDFIYLRGGQVETFRAHYTVDVNGVSEQIEVLSGHEQLQTQTRGTFANRFFTKDGSVFNRRVIFPAQQGVVLQWPQIQKSYQLKFYGNGRVAGRNVLAVDIRPHQPDRYGYRIAIDQQTGVQLNREVYDAQQRMIEKIMFVDFALVDDGANYPDGTEESKSHSPHKPVNNEEAEKRTVIRVNSAQLPDGFALKRHEWLQKTDLATEHLLYSDELALISVYIEPVQPEWVPRYGQLQMGAISVFFQPLGKYEMILLGELPMETLRKMAAGFTLKESTDD